MKALYLHGYKSKLSEEKISILKKSFDLVISPDISWDDVNERHSIFDRMVDIIKSNNITHVIGSSMGGQMSFYLGSYCNIRSISFNPAFNYLFNDFNFKTGNGNKNSIILGSKDEVINHYDSINFLNSLNVVKRMKVINSGHRISLETFKTELIYNL